MIGTLDAHDVARLRRRQALCLLVGSRTSSGGIRARPSPSLRSHGLALYGCAALALVACDPATAGPDGAVSDAAVSDAAASDAAASDAAASDAAPPDAATDSGVEVDAGGGLPRATSMLEQSAALRGIAVDLDALYWNPEAFPERYPPGGSGPFTRAFAPPCRDGTSPADRTCADGAPVRCADGTRPVYYVRRGTTNRWLVRIQNGGLVCSIDYGASRVRRNMSNCWSRYQHGDPGDASALTSSGSAARMSLGGIYDVEGGSPFADYNIVILDKCVGDRNLGDTTVEDYVYRDARAIDAPVDEYAGPVYFHGVRIVEAILRGLARDGANPSLDAVAFQTHSNGSSGLYQTVDRLAAVVRELVPGADVRGILTGMIRGALEVEATADASGRTDASAVYDRLGAFDDIALHVQAGASSPAHGQWISARPYMPGGLEHARHAAWGGGSPDPVVDASCVSAHGAGAGACVDQMHVLLNHVSTPLFLVAQQRDGAVNDSQNTFNTAFDTTSGCDPGATCCHDENYPSGEDCESFPGRPFYPIESLVYAPGEFADRVVSTIRALHEGLATRSEMRPGCAGSPCDTSALPSPAHAAFIDDTSDHFSVHEPSRASSVIGGRALGARLRGWLETGAETMCVDVSAGLVRTSGTPAGWGRCVP